jgi:hypothetical protein
MITDLHKSAEEIQNEKVVNLKGQNPTLAELAKIIPLKRMLLIGFKHIKDKDGFIVEHPLVINNLYGGLITHTTELDEGYNGHPRFDRPPLGGDIYFLPQPSFSVFADFSLKLLDEVFQGQGHLGYEIQGMSDPIDWEKRLINAMGEKLDQLAGIGMEMDKPNETQHARKAKA